MSDALGTPAVPKPSGRTRARIGHRCTRTASWRRRALGGTTLAGAMLLAACGIGAGAAGASSKHKTLTTVTMEIPSPHGVTYLPYYAGIKYGIFAKYGIKLTMQLIKSTLATTLMEDGKLDLMAATGSAESASVHGHSLPTYVAQGLRQDFTFTAGKGITSMSQLKGKVIVGESAISAANQWEKAVLKANGITPKNTVTFVTAGTTDARAAYVLAGKGAATAMSVTAGLKLQRTTGLNTLTLGNIPATDLVAGGFAADPSWVKSHKKLMHNLVDATVKSTQFVVKNKAKSIKVLEGTPYTLTPTFAKDVYKDVKPNWVPSGKPPKVAIEAQLKTLQRTYTLPKPPAATLIFTWSFIPKS